MSRVQMIPVPDSIKNDRLYMALELSNKNWKIAFSNGFKIRMKNVGARDLKQFEEEVKKSRRHFGMGEEVPLYCCYEAGRDGFWIHRYLLQCGIHNVVVDSSSIEVNRRYRRTKTDRVDANKLVTMLIRYLNGETKLWSVVRVPEAKDEDARRLNREIERLKKERSAHTNRIKSLLALHGIAMSVGKSFREDIAKAILWNGEPVPPRVKQEMLREYDRNELIRQQLEQLEAEKEAVLRAESKSSKKVLTLQKLKGIGPVSSWVLVYEFLGWRVFNNGKEVGASAGLAPSPYASGESQREQGISKSGNRRIRALMIEIAWYWLRYQSASKLSLWYMVKYGGGSKRVRRIGIVALARKLLIALWRYVDHGVVPEGAQLKSQELICG